MEYAEQIINNIMDDWRIFFVVCKFYDEIRDLLLTPIF